MAVSWTRHRFSGGVLALDTANTVVLRDDPARRFDRFDDPGEIERFAEAATLFCRDELGGRKLAVADAAVAGKVLVLREAVDGLFREAATEGAVGAERLVPMLSACADLLAGRRERLGAVERPFGDPSMPVVAFEAALAWSALSLLHGEARRRIRICGNCGWLFLDRSRNGSRIWCDMAVCGNRRKARRHYERRRGTREDGHV